MSRGGSVGGGPGPLGCEEGVRGWRSPPAPRSAPWCFQLGTRHLRARCAGMTLAGMRWTVPQIQQYDLLMYFFVFFINNNEVLISWEMLLKSC